MKILHILFSFNPGGIENMLVDIINEQTKKHDIYLFIINDSVHQSLLDSLNTRVKVRLFNRKPQSKGLMIFFRLHKHIRDVNPVIIHCHHPKLRRLFPFIRRKTILTMHSMNIPIYQLRQYDHLVAISEAVRQDVVSRGGLTSTTILNGINFSLIKQKPLQSKDKNPFRLVQVASLNHQIKGQHILFQALSYLIHNEHHHAVTLDLIGAGCSESYLRQLSVDLRINDHVRFIGLKTRDYIYDQLQHYDILVQPSLSEGFGLTVIEGMAARIPVLVSNIDGPMEIVQQGSFGSYFKVGDAVDCAEKLDTIINGYDSETFQSDIEKAYHNALIKYNINLTVLKYFEIYSGQTGKEFNA